MKSTSLKKMINKVRLEDTVRPLCSLSLKASVYNDWSLFLNSLDLNLINHLRFKLRVLLSDTLKI